MFAPSGTHRNACYCVRQLTREDCSCISVNPQESSHLYIVTNRCNPLGVVVRFGGDTLRLSPRIDAFTTWVDAGTIAAGEQPTVRAPGHWTIRSILAVHVRNKTSSFTCTF